MVRLQSLRLAALRLINMVWMEMRCKIMPLLLGFMKYISLITIKNCTRAGQDEKTQIIVYPNPSRKEVHIWMDEHFAERLTKVQVYDVLGNILMETDARSQEIAFELLKDGVYMVVLHTKDGGTTIRKVIIQDKIE
jgi:bifunctional DNase/RNase